MEKRENELLKLKFYTEGIDKELTMILQSLQWDRNDLIECATMAICKYNKSHRIPLDKRKEHEVSCFYKQQGYNSNDEMLPDPFDANANTLVKLNIEDISLIIGTASKLDPTFRKGNGSGGPEPSSLAGLQAAYTADERRAIHDAVVSAVPSCHDLADLALFSSNNEEQKSGRSKSRVEILAELRDMRRRRAKYRGAAKTRNYSDVLRDVIQAQMEFYADVPSDASVATTKENGEINKQTDNGKHHEHSNTKQTYKTDDHKHDRYNDSRDTFEDRGSRWGSEHRSESINCKDRYVERSRDKRNDYREEFYKRKYEIDDGIYGGSSKHKDYDSRADRNIHQDRYRDRRYGSGPESTEREHKDRRSKHKDESNSHRTDRVRQRSKERYESRVSLTKEDGNKYDKHKSRDSKRRYEERSKSSYRENKSQGDLSQRDKVYSRYYDVLEQNCYDKKKKTNK